MANNYSLVDANNVKQTFLTNDTTGGNVQLPRTQQYDGTNAQLSASAANLATPSAANAMLISQPGQWVAYSNPGSGVTASASQAAPGAGVYNIITGFIVSLSGDGTGAAFTGTLNLRNGATGAGSILAQMSYALPAGVSAQSAPLVVTGLNIPCSANTAATLEFTANTAHALQSITLFGTTSK